MGLYTPVRVLMPNVQSEAKGLPIRRTLGPEGAVLSRTRLYAMRTVAALMESPPPCATRANEVSGEVQRGKGAALLGMLLGAGGSVWEVGECGPNLRLR